MDRYQNEWRISPKFFFRDDQRPLDYENSDGTRAEKKILRRFDVRCGDLPIFGAHRAMHTRTQCECLFRAKRSRYFCAYLVTNACQGLN